MLLIVVGKDARYPVISHPYCILFCNTVQYISRDITEVVYVNSFNKVSVFGFEPQVDMFINRPRGPRHLHLQHIGTCVGMEHHKYWDSPLIHLTFVSTLRWAAAYARMHSLVCRRKGSQCRDAVVLFVGTIQGGARSQAHSFTEPQP